ncbi:MAG: insulinase family protein [Thermoplasmata archaeon]|nr:insulinase family protein [Thermoplasmata archaeon]
MTKPRRDPLGWEEAETDGGVTVLCQPAPAGSASFSATYLAPAGWEYDPPGCEGLATATADLIPTGAGRRRHLELARELDRYGATLTAEVNSESLQVTLWGPDREYETLLPILADAVLHPRWDSRELARALREMRESQMREMTQPDQRADRDLSRRIFPPGHPYQESGTGTAASLGRITRSRLTEFHRRHFSRRGARIVITSDRSPAQLRQGIGKLFSEWPRDDPPAVPELPSPRPTRPGEVGRIPLPSRGQAEIRMGGPSLPRSDPRYPALLLADEILGGRSILSRLFQNLREKRGLVYGAGSELESLRGGGVWQAEAGTDPARVEKVIRLLRQEVDRICHDLARADELHRIRESSLGSLQLHLETTQGAHSLAVEAAYYQLPSDFYRTWPQTLRAVDPRQIREAASVGFDPKRASLVVAGPV